MWKMLPNILFAFALLVSALSLVLIGVSIGARNQEENTLKLCKDTGMYLSKGYALSCRVLTNEGYYPKKEQ